MCSLAPRNDFFLLPLCLRTPRWPRRSQHTSVTPHWSNIVANSLARFPLGHAGEKPDPAPFLIAFECHYKDIHVRRFAAVRAWMRRLHYFAASPCVPPQDSSFAGGVLVSRRSTGILFYRRTEMQWSSARAVLYGENMTYTPPFWFRCSWLPADSRVYNCHEDRIHLCG